MDEFRVVFIYKDPVAALVSRFDHNHCRHVQGDCGDEAAWPSLAQYAAQQRDRMQLQAHFDAYLHPPSPKRPQRKPSSAEARTYPVVRSLVLVPIHARIEAGANACAFSPTDCIFSNCVRWR
jgi:hypothetical protein